ncbi:MAG TPA: hypothetical protein VEF04_05565, partial [Blastocatellia bacterium]|nr:hypothetical protein [Blastocatellia bacterium]
MRFALAISLIVFSVFAQEPPKRIGVIDFFGHTGIDLAKINASIPLREGDEFNIEAAEEKVNQSREIITKLIGHPPTDISIGCCDSNGNWTIQFGLSGKSFPDHPNPKGTSRLPPQALSLYEQYMNGVMEAVQKGE